MKNQKGISLTELMVTMLLGLVLIAGIGHLFLSANRTYILQDELSRIQENARVAMDILTQDIRMAGFTSCPQQAALANAIATNTNDRAWMAHFDRGILGIPVSENSRVDSAADSEIIIVHKLDLDRVLTVNSHNTSAATLTSNATHTYNEGDVLALISQQCDQVSVLKATRNTTGSTIEHVSSAASSLFNCTSLLGGNFNCRSGSVTDNTFSHTGSTIAPVTSVAYYLRENNSVPNLYRKFIGETTAGQTINPTPLIEGIEDLSLLYGIDSNDDRNPDRYVTATTLGLFSNNWSNVVSVRIELLVRSFSEITDQPQSYFFAGTTRTPTDRFLRRNFVTTVELRNRVQQ